MKKPASPLGQLARRGLSLLLCCLLTVCLGLPVSSAAQPDSAGDTASTPADSPEPDTPEDSDSTDKPDTALRPVTVPLPRTIRTSPGTQMRLTALPRRLRRAPPGQVFLLLRTVPQSRAALLSLTAPQNLLRSLSLCGSSSMKGTSWKSAFSRAVLCGLRMCPPARVRN